MSTQSCSYVSDGSGALVSSVCTQDSVVFSAYSGSLQFVTVARISPDGEIQFNKDAEVWQDFLIHNIVFPLLGLYVFLRLIKWWFNLK